MSESKQTMLDTLEQIAAFNIKPSTGTSVAMLMRDIAKAALRASAEPKDERALEDVRWAVNVLLEKIAEKFEGWDTHDIWRSDAAMVVRSFKHDLTRPAGPKCGCLACDVDGPHASSCAVHNGTAMDIGPCDCGASAFSSQGRGGAPSHQRSQGE